MPDTTPTLGLLKPLGGEKLNVDVFNTNMDTIDDFVTAAPDDLADLSARISAVEAPWTETDATHNMTLGSGGSCKTYHRAVGKTITGRVVVVYGSGFVMPSTGVRVALPVIASAKYGSVEGSCLGAARFHRPYGVGTIFLSGDRTQLGFYVGVTANYSSGPWGGDLGATGITWNFSGAGGLFMGEFIYEID